MNLIITNIPDKLDTKEDNNSSFNIIKNQQFGSSMNKNSGTNQAKSGIYHGDNTELIQ